MGNGSGKTDNVVQLQKHKKLSKQKEDFDQQIPEYDRTMIATCDNLDDAIKAIKAKAELEWNDRNRGRLSELEKLIPAAQREHKFAQEQVEESRRDLKNTPRWISGKALRSKRIQEVNHHGSN